MDYMDTTFYNNTLKTKKNCTNIFGLVSNLSTLLESSAASLVKITTMSRGQPPAGSEVKVPVGEIVSKQHCVLPSRRINGAPASCPRGSAVTVLRGRGEGANSIFPGRTDGTPVPSTRSPHFSHYLLTSRQELKTQQ